MLFTISNGSVSSVQTELSFLPLLTGLQTWDKSPASWVWIEVLVMSSEQSVTTNNFQWTCKNLGIYLWQFVSKRHNWKLESSKTGNWTPELWWLNNRVTARRCLTADYPLFLCYTKTTLNELIISSDPQIYYMTEQKACWGRRTNYWSSPYKNVKDYRNNKLANTLLLFKKQESQYHGNTPTEPCNLTALFPGCNGPPGKQTEPSLIQAVGEAQAPRNLMTWLASAMREPGSNILHLWVTPKQLFVVSTGYKSALLCKAGEGFSICRQQRTDRAGAALCC